MTRCDRCLLPLATPALMDHPDGCDCPMCRQHCWSEYGNYCTVVTGAQERARIVAELRAYAAQPVTEAMSMAEEASWYDSIAVIHWLAKRIEDGVPFVDAEILDTSGNQS